MAWTHPRTWSVSDLASAALLNAGIRDNLIALGTMTQGGSITISVTTINTNTSGTVTFPVAFPSTPNVSVTVMAANVGTGVGAPGVTAISSTGCTLWALRTGTSGNVTLQWVATAGPYT